jgi:hypothetical protein
VDAEYSFPASPSEKHIVIVRIVSGHSFDDYAMESMRPGELAPKLVFELSAALAANRCPTLRKVHEFRPVREH